MVRVVAVGVTMATHCLKTVDRALNALITALSAKTQPIAGPPRYAADALQAIL